MNSTIKTADAKGAHQSPMSRLTEGERNIIILVAQQYENIEIAAQLSIAEQTVDNHLHTIFTKMGVNSRAELIAKSGLADLSAERKEIAALVVGGASRAEILSQSPAHPVVTRFLVREMFATAGVHSLGELREHLLKKKRKPAARRPADAGPPAPVSGADL